MTFFKANDLPPAHLAFLGGQETASIIGEDDSLDLIDKPPPTGHAVPLHSQMASVAARQSLFAEEMGTAFRIGPRTWLTAGHVLRHYRRGFTASTIELTIGYATGQRFSANSQIHPGWTDMDAIGSDLAVLTLDAVPPGPVLPFRLAAEPTTALRKSTVNVVGYRSPFDVRWRVTEIDYNVLGDRLFHVGDTLPGESGGPLIVWPPLSEGSKDLTVVGIHSRGVDDPVSRPGRNTATRITSELLSWLEERIV